MRRTENGALTRCVLALGFGSLFVFGGGYLLHASEAGIARATSGISEALEAVTEARSDALSAADEGKLVHVVGRALATRPIRDPRTGVEIRNQVMVLRDVEMYQWIEEEHSGDNSRTDPNRYGSHAVYTYHLGWSPRREPIQGASRLEVSQHENPPMPFSSSRLVAADAHLGVYVLDARTFASSNSKALKVTPPSGWVARGGWLYDTQRTDSRLGDLRVSYRGMPSGSTVTVVGRQVGHGFAPYRTGSGYEVLMSKLGRWPATAVLKAKRLHETLLKWPVRIFATLLLLLGFRLLTTRDAGKVLFFLRWGRRAPWTLSLAFTVALGSAILSAAWRSVGGRFGMEMLALAIAGLIGAFAVWGGSSRGAPPPEPADRPPPR